MLGFRARNGAPAVCLRLLKGAADELGNHVGLDRTPTIVVR